MKPTRRAFIRPLKTRSSRFTMNEVRTGLPHEWIARAKNAIQTITPQFSTRRMVKEYVERLYLPALRSAPEGLPKKRTRRKV